MGSKYTKTRVTERISRALFKNEILRSLAEEQQFQTQSLLMTSCQFNKEYCLIIPVTLIPSNGWCVRSRSAFETVSFNIKRSSVEAVGISSSPVQTHHNLVKILFTAISVLIPRGKKLVSQVILFLKVTMIHRTTSSLALIFIFWFF